MSRPAPNGAPHTAPFTLTLHDPHGGFPRLLPVSEHLWGYLRQRAQLKPDTPLWFGSQVHLAMMANLAFDRSETALQELLAAGLVEQAFQAEATAGEGGGGMSQQNLRPTAPQPVTPKGHTVIDPDEMARVWAAGHAEAAATYVWIVRCAQLGEPCTLETLHERYADAEPAGLAAQVHRLIDIGMVRWEGGAV